MRVSKIERYNKMLEAALIHESYFVNPNGHPLPKVDRSGKPKNAREKTACDLYDAAMLEGAPEPGTQIPYYE